MRAAERNRNYRDHICLGTNWQATIHFASDKSKGDIDMNDEILDIRYEI